MKKATYTTYRLMTLNGITATRTIEIFVDHERIAERMARKALDSKSGQARVVGGAVRVRVS